MIDSEFEAKVKLMRVEEKQMLRISRDRKEDCILKGGRGREGERCGEEKK